MTTTFKKNKESTIFNINIPFVEAGSSIFSVTSDRKLAMRNNLLALIHTNVGDRVMSNFGSDLGRLIMFENINLELEQQAVTLLQNKVDEWMSYIEILNIKISSQENQINMQITWRERNSQYTDTLETSF